MLNFKNSAAALKSPEPMNTDYTILKVRNKFIMMNRLIHRIVNIQNKRHNLTLKDKISNILITLATVLLTVCLTELLFTLGMNSQSLMMIYVLSILFVSLTTPGYTYGIASAVLSSLACDFFTTEGFNLSSGLPITLFTMLVTTFIISAFTIQLKEYAVLALDREKRAQLLYEINQKLLAARELNAIIKITNQYLVSNLGFSVVFYTGDPASPNENTQIALYNNESEQIFFSEEEVKRAHRVFRGEESEILVNKKFDGGIIYIPVMSKGNILGVIGINCGKDLMTLGKLTFAQMLAGQVAVVLEMQSMTDEQNLILVGAEKEKMRATLLRSISHDLRTPLTSIVGASSTILENPQIERETLESLAGDIKENSKWLIRMVENILTITKITSDSLTLTKKPEAVEEVISHTVSIVRKRFPDCNIHIRIPEELLIVPMDATLISQVLINLLENAIKNSPEISLILLDVKKENNYAKFDISDNGGGIPEQFLENLFEIHSPQTEPSIDSSRGMGIGLSICRTIIQAHKGIISGQNKKDGGAKFTFSLPLEEA